jgi:hypothetical protein
LLAGQLETVRQQLSIRIDTVNDIAFEALSKANQALAINLDPIQAQINDILFMLTQEITRAKGKFPLVDGAVPPNLMYMEDGSLFYEETF